MLHTHSCHVIIGRCFDKYIDLHLIQLTKCYITIWWHTHLYNMTNLLDSWSCALYLIYTIILRRMSYFFKNTVDLLFMNWLPLTQSNELEYFKPRLECRYHLSSTNIFRSSVNTLACDRFRGVGFIPKRLHSEQSSFRHVFNPKIKMYYFRVRVRTGA